MNPAPSSEVAKKRMENTRQRDTPAEMALRRALFRRGLRYRVDSSPIPTLRRRADVVFPKARLAVFVDGCFWHGCPQHATQPLANGDWWRTKLMRNQERDRDTVDQLVKAGWSVVRVWEHESPESAAGRVIAVLRS